jgi:predicted phosphodiesterase
MGSLYEHQDVLNLAYKVFHKEGIDTVYHTGDMCDGEKMRRGHEYDIYVHGADAQVKNCVEKYPRFKGIRTFFILGGHDISFWVHSGVDIGEKIAEKRKDLICLGRDEQDVALSWRGRQARVRLLHPWWGSAYALSYQIQKYIDSLSGGQKPNIVLCGHTHKAEYLPCYRNVFTLQTGCIQGQTPFMRGKNLASHVGFWIVEFRIDPEGGVSRLKAEFFPVYEERFYTEVKVK